MERLNRFENRGIKRVRTIKNVSLRLFERHPSVGSYGACRDLVTKCYNKMKQARDYLNIAYHDATGVETCFFFFLLQQNLNRF